MNTALIWIQAARPKTLPVVMAPLLIALAISKQEGSVSFRWWFVTLVCALLIQIGTNYANDYFDAQKGADTKDRLGPPRATALGLVRPHSMKRAFIYAFMLAACVGLLLVWRAGWPIVWIGISSVVCGILYTAGPYALAYIGGAELFVVAYFGVIATAGGVYVQTLRFSLTACLIGLVPGLVAAAVLCVNNLRDYPQDKRANKKTWAVRFGKNFARFEYTLCIILAFVIPVAMVLWGSLHPLALLVLLACFAAKNLLLQVWNYEDPRHLNQCLAGTGKLSVTMAFLLSFGIICGA